MRDDSAPHIAVVLLLPSGGADTSVTRSATGVAGRAV